MEQGDLYKLVQNLTKKEKKEVESLLKSPYFNTRSDLPQLFALLCSTEAPDKQEIWQALHGPVPYEDTKFRLLQSYLNQCLEQYLLVRELRFHPAENHLQLAQIYRKRQLSGHYNKHLNLYEQAIEAQNARNGRYYEEKTALLRERYYRSVVNKPFDAASMLALTESMDLAYLMGRLQLICLGLAQKNVYATHSNTGYEDKIMGMAAQWADHPMVGTWLAAIQMLAEPAEPKHYHRFREQVAEHKHLFDREEVREFYLFILNYGVRKANTGDENDQRDLFDIYKEALAEGYLFEEGQLSRFSYHNIAGAGLKVGDLEWVAAFLEQYKPFLEARYRESSYQFSRARLAYASQRFDEVLLLLQQANYTDVLLNLAAKTLLVKTLYEIGEYDSLVSYLDAMKNFIRRSKVIGYHRTNYLNVVKYIEKLLQCHGNKAKMAALRQRLTAEQALTEREWLLSKTN